MTSGEPLDRCALRAALLETAPWLADPDRGPRAVDAGPCDRCGTSPRLLPTCGPGGGRAVCRTCAFELGDDGWCEGHRDDGAAARAWAAALPERWADAVTLWWVATGEVRSDDAEPPDVGPWLPDGHADGPVDSRS